MESKDITIEWRDCYIYGERYEVSNSGFVRNKKTNRILRQQVDKKGYMRVRLCLNCVKVTAKVHRLVAIAFLSNPNMKPQVNHIDTNKKNNCVSNLEWATNSENQLHAYRNGLKKIHGGGRYSKMGCIVIQEEFLRYGKVVCRQTYLCWICDRYV